MSGRGVDQYLLALAGWPVFSAARSLVGAGLVTSKPLGQDVLWGTVDDGDLQHGLAVRSRWEGDRLTELSGVCPACTNQPCVHAVAVALDHWGGAEAATREVRVPWQDALEGITATPRDHDEVALQVEVRLGDPLPGRRRGVEVLVRPLRRGARGSWVRTGVSWDGIVRGPRDRWGYGWDPDGVDVAEPVRSLLRELRRLCADEDDLGRRWGSGRSAPLDLGAALTGRAWELLRELQKAGVEILRHQPKNAPVVVDAEPAVVEVVADRPGEQLQLSTRVAVGQAQPDGDHCAFVGEPAHGLVWWADGDPALHLAALAAPVAEDLLALHTAPLPIPAEDEEVFATTYYPTLRRTHRVRTEERARLPEPVRTELVVEVERPVADELHLSWAWRTGPAHRRRRVPLYGFVAVDREEERHRQAVLADVRAAIDEVPATQGLLDAAGRLRLPSVAAGEVMVAVLEDLLPRLVRLGVVVDTDEPLPELRDPVDPPRVEFVTHETPTYNDWFDLGVSVVVDGESIALADLIEVLGRGRRVYVSRFGTKVRLDAPELVRLAELIAESQELHDAPLGTLRVGRGQAGVLLDVEDVGRLSGPAADWAQRLRALPDAVLAPPPEPPPTLLATLRPYQLTGFAWLATLYRLGLGGVLADDMGLGKTLQTLALLCHVAQEADDAGRRRPRFLVVAPTSVVHTWEREAARHAPGLRVAVVAGTRARRRTGIDELAADADVVVTSYTLLRLEARDYAAVDWDGVVLDEAQTVKNRRTTTYRDVASLRAPFRLAVSGTPVENDLMELWAVMTLVAPGVLGSAGRFREAYAVRIEKDRHGPTLERLRRRIRPLVLRRTKAEVASDLPDRQEQVLELDLAPEHRVAYDRILQRERQKVLGLIQDEQHFESNRFAVFRSLTTLRQAAISLALLDDEATDVPCAKLDALAEIVTDVAAEGHRVLVFSQFTRFLTAARDRLAESGIACEYLDGSTTRRQEVVDRFRGGDAPVFLISLKAGGTGLTLTEADYCIVLDPWWNPAAEAQAVDRAHRIGQTRKVNVYRLVSRGTIEEKVMALKSRKAAVVAYVLDGGDLGSGQLTSDDVRELLR